MPEAELDVERPQPALALLQGERPDGHPVEVREAVPPRLEREGQVPATEAVRGLGPDQVDQRFRNAWSQTSFRS